MLTIGQLASYAGVTIRAVRHYHAKGLLAEPERDRSGYRRYDAAAVIELIRIRTLADAGVPLSRVKQLLEADEEEFATAVAEIDQRIRAEIRERQQHRRRIARLAAGDSLALPPVVVGYLQRLRELGVHRRVLELERDGWILVSAHYPDQIEEWIAGKTADLEDPEFQDLYRSISACIDAAPDDPRLEALADRLARILDRAEAETEEQLDGPLAALVDAVTVEMTPAWHRLEELMEERGFVGWNQLERVDPAG
ncbi:MerR family transcriptional regulator [Patulibacter medicamentivorans]|uniref:MerR family transcriptional regulator n=1 Tax=Patulibacter medicamentivorans TaxID=1097667 RepID=UPI00058D6586|nr:MerR family transcriptional regulator [Patulibacter medicamentivorans]